MVSGKRYIPIENILSQVKLRLRSFEEAGLLSEPTMIDNAIHVLDRTGYNLEEHKTLVLDIHNYEVDIPEDLKFIERIYKCNNSESTSKKKTTRSSNLYDRILWIFWCCSI